jgi:hypothetical protein
MSLVPLAPFSTTLEMTILGCLVINDDSLTDTQVDLFETKDN